MGILAGNAVAALVACFAKKMIVKCLTKLRHIFDTVFVLTTEIGW